MTATITSSPHQHIGRSSQELMLWVSAACIPGFLAQVYWFGYGTLLNLIWAIVLGLGIEVAVMYLRSKPVKRNLMDASALVTCVLLGLALPPFAPWWLVSVAVLFAILFAKHLYGGLGNNPFNPAMVGYAICLIAFPSSMTLWASTEQQLDLAQQWQWFWNEDLPIDAVTQATPLDVYKHLQGKTLTEVRLATPTVTIYAAAAYWINAAYLLGGLVLLALRVFTWHAPIAMLASLAIISGLFSTGEPDLYIGPLDQLALGATMMAAFFIITDPVTSATSRRGKLIFGAGIGILIYVIRTWGSYPDAVAFAVLLMNLSAPLIDQYTRPKVYGQNLS